MSDGTPTDVVPIEVNDRVTVNMPDHSFHGFKGEVVRLVTVDGIDWAQVWMDAGQRQYACPEWQGGTWLFAVENLTK